MRYLTLLLLLLLACGCTHTVTKAELDAKALEHAGFTFPDQTFYVGSDDRYDYFVIRSGLSGSSRRYRVAESDGSVTNRFGVTKNETRWRGYGITGIVITNAIALPKGKRMNCTLDICGERKIQNPTETDIRQAVFALNTKSGDAFLVLGPADMTYIQTSGDQKVGFDLEYQETDSKHHYRAKRDLTADEVLKALVSYSIGADDWKRMVEWERLDL